jgi:hypothetical protein
MDTLPPNARPLDSSGRRRLPPDGVITLGRLATFRDM